MRGLVSLILLVILSVTTSVICEPKKNETEKKVEFKSAYPYGYGTPDVQNPYYNGLVNQNPYSGYTYSPQPVSNSYAVPQQSYSPYGESSYPYYQPLTNSQPIQYQYPTGSYIDASNPTGYNLGSYPSSSYPGINYPATGYYGANYPSVTYSTGNYPSTGYAGASYPVTGYSGSYPSTSYAASNYPSTGYNTGNYPSTVYSAANYPSTVYSGSYPSTVAGYPVINYPTVSNNVPSASGGQDPFAGVQTDIIDVDLAKPNRGQSLSKTPAATATSSQSLPYVYLSPQSFSGSNVRSYPGFRNSYDEFANVPTEIIDIPSDDISTYLKPKVEVKSYSYNSGADPIIRTHSSSVTTKPITATITRVLDPSSNNQEPIRISYVNGERVDEEDMGVKQEEKADATPEITSNSIGNNKEEEQEVEEDEDEDEEPANVNSWF